VRGILRDIEVRHAARSKARKCELLPGWRRTTVRIIDSAAALG
jgi:hypothetical protein